MSTPSNETKYNKTKTEKSIILVEIPATASAGPQFDCGSFVYHYT